MSQQSLLKKISDAVSEITRQPAPELEKISLEVRLKDLGITSLKLFQFVTLLEKKTDIVLDELDFEAINFVTLKSTLMLLERYGVK